MKKLLVPTDFSDNARHALIVALKLAQKMGAEVLVCSVYDQPSSGQSVMRDLSEQMRKTTLEDLEQEVEAVHTDFPDLRIKISAVKGATAEAIAKTADLEKCDLIVMGKTGRSGFSNKLFGSVALQTIQESDHPLLLVPEQWKYKEIDKLCLATDLSDMDYGDVLKPLVYLTKLFGAEVDMLHFAPDQSALDTFHAKGETARKKIETALEEVQHRFVFGINPDARKALFNHLDNDAFHMMCMIKHEYPWIHKVFNSSPTVDTAIRTRVPLLILH